MVLVNQFSALMVTMPTQQEHLHAPSVQKEVIAPLHQYLPVLGATTALLAQRCVNHVLEGMSVWEDLYQSFAPVVTTHPMDQILAYSVNQDMNAP